MKPLSRLFTAIAIASTLVTFGCSTDAETESHESNTEGRGEHDRDGGEHRGEGGEESGGRLALTETYDKVRKGARLTMSYDASSNAFVGTVHNTTDATLDQVRVEVHLSNGKELGPTPAQDLAPGKSRDVELKATSTDFDRWTAHPEVGRGEHGGEHGGEGRGEHSREGRGEHRD